MTPARAAQNLAAVVCALEEAGIPVRTFRGLVDDGCARWFIKLGRHEIVSAWRKHPETCPHILTDDRHGVRIWSRP